MKKIRNITDLQQAQQSIELRRLQLEKELRHDWNDTKEYLAGGGNSFFDTLKKQYTSKLVLQGLSFGAGLLTRKFGGKIGGKILGWFK